VSLTIQSRKARSMPGVGQQMGDPGIFGDIGRFIGGAVKSVPIFGGLVGGGITALSNALDPVKPKTQPTSVPFIKPMNIQSVQTNGGYAQPGLPRPGFVAAAQRAVPGGQTGMMQAPKGYRLNKTGYYTKSEGWVEPGTKFVKIRRRNPLNPKALDRAISRIESGKRASKKLSRVTVRKRTACR